MMAQMLLWGNEPLAAAMSDGDRRGRLMKRARSRSRGAESKERQHRTKADVSKRRDDTVAHGGR